MGFVTAVSRVFLAFLTATRRLSVFAGTSVMHCVHPPIYPRLILHQIIDVGYYSLPAVGLTVDRRADPIAGCDV